jgi:hypothetical protein
LGIPKYTSRLWRNRWLELRDVELPVQEKLEDAARSGKPATFTIEQLTQLYALAYNPPQKYGRPISHWTPRELADELIEQKSSSALVRVMSADSLQKLTSSLTRVATGYIPPRPSVQSQGRRHLRGL